MKKDKSPEVESEFLGYFSSQKTLYCAEFNFPLRLGPSASQLMIPGIDEEKVSEVVQALSLIRSVMSEPWAQRLMGTVAPVDELAKAQHGLPASSKPMPAAPMTLAAPATATAKPHPATPAATASPTTAAPVPADPATPPAAVPTAPAEPAEQVVNSSTHRAAHARLARRMASMTEADAPNMAKLWSGNRKDSLNQTQKRSKTLENLTKKDCM